MSIFAASHELRSDNIDARHDARYPMEIMEQMTLAVTRPPSITIPCQTREEI